MTWTNLSFAFGSLLTSTKMTQLYDNLTALANGDSGAPKINPNAFRTYASGSYMAYESPRVREVSSSTYNVAGEFITAIGGNFTVGYVRTVPGGNTASTEVRVNSIAVSSAYSSGVATTTLITKDLTGINSGDLIQVFGKYDGGSTTVTINAFGIMADGPFFFGAAKPNGLDF